MQLLQKSIAVSLFALTASYANAATISFDNFDDQSTAATDINNNVDTDTVTDANGNDLFATREIKVTSVGTNQVANINADVSIAGELAYSAETGVKSVYELSYVLDAPTDFTLGKGFIGPNDFFEVFVIATDFSARFEANINNGGYVELGSFPAGIGSVAAPTVVSYGLGAFATDVTNVSSVEFRITPLNFNGEVAQSADGQFAFFRLNAEPAAIVPVPSSILMMIAGLFGIRRIRKAA